MLEIGGKPAEKVVFRQADLQGVDNAFGAMEERYLLSNAGVMEALGLTGEGGTDPSPRIRGREEIGRTGSRAGTVHVRMAVLG